MDNIELIKKAHAGDKLSREKLIEMNTGLIWSIVKRFMNRGYDREDLFQIGCIGMLKAINQFDLHYKVAFSTYAVPLIMGEIRRFLRDDGLIKVSRQIKENQTKITAFRQDYLKRTGKDATLKEIEENCRIPAEEILYAMEAADSVLSVDNQDSGNSPLLERLSAESDFEQEVVNKILMQQAIKQLLPEEKALIQFRYYENKTQSETGNLLNMSQVQVSRMEKKCFEKIKRFLSESE